MRVYGTSKLCNILFTRELAKRAPELHANCFHPGVVRTGFGKNDNGIWKVLTTLGGPFFRSPQRGARSLIWLSLSERGGRAHRRVHPRREGADPQRPGPGRHARRGSLGTQRPACGAVCRRARLTVGESCVDGQSHRAPKIDPEFVQKHNDGGESDAGERCPWVTPVKGLRRVSLEKAPDIDDLDIRGADHVGRASLQTVDRAIPEAPGGVPI